MSRVGSIFLRVIAPALIIAVSIGIAGQLVRSKPRPPRAARPPEPGQVGPDLELEVGVVHHAQVPLLPPAARRL